MVRIIQWKDLYRLIVSLRQPKSLSSLYSAEQFHVILEREKARAERNSHQFSLVLFDVSKVVGNTSQMRYLIHSLTNRIRVADEMGWLDDDCIGILLPDTSAIGAERFAQSTCDAVAAKCLLPEYTIYTYSSESFPDSNGHSSQLNFADIYPQWETRISRDLFGSERHNVNRS